MQEELWIVSQLVTNQKICMIFILWRTQAIRKRKQWDVSLKFQFKFFFWKCKFLFTEQDWESTEWKGQSAQPAGRLGSCDLWRHRRELSWKKR